MSNEGRESNVELGWDLGRSHPDRSPTAGAEIRIPFRTLKFTDRSPQSWGLNFQRRLRRRNEESFWSPLPRIYSLERVSLAGSLDGLDQLRPGRNLRVKPFAGHRSSTVATAPADGDVTSDST